MKIDNSKPWEESPTKRPKLGEVLESIVEIEKNRVENSAALVKQLSEVEKNTKSLLTEFDTQTDAAIKAHTAKKGPAHGEDKSTIGLGKKENLPAASLTDIQNGNYKREWLTPLTLQALVERELDIDPDLYVTSGSLPLSYGVTLGRALFNQRFISTKDVILETPIAKGISSFLLSTEESYLLFGDHGQGILTEFSTGGKQAPIGPMTVDIRNDNITTVRATPASLNDITVSDSFIKTMTGLGFGYGDYNGNFYDSNFHPTVPVDNKEVNTSIKQSSDASLFDKTIIYKPEGQINIRNYNLTKHNFNELVFPTEGSYPLDAATFMSADEVLIYTANCGIAQQGGVWGILFDFVSGNIGTPDWYPDTINKKTNKILSKKAGFTIRQTTINKIDGYEGALGVIRQSSKTIPFGVGTERANFNYSNFAGSSRYASAFIPIESIIKGFNGQSDANKQKVLARIDLELIKRITMAWVNKLTYQAVLRIPFFLNGAKTDTEYGFHMWVDLSFRLNIEEDYNTVDMAALNFNTANRPTLDANLDLTGTLGKFEKINGGIKDNPLHPKVMGGCFVESGGHIQAYVAGYRQYICYYKHQVGNALDWIQGNMKPVITDTKVRDNGTYPTNGAYGDNGRLIPVKFTADTIQYLAYIRNKKGKHQYAVMDYPLNFDLIKNTFSNPTEITWLDRAGEKDIPVLITNTDYTKAGFEVSGMVFTEGNGYIGSYDPNWNGANFSPKEVVKINSVFQSRVQIAAKIKNPHTIFFYYNSVLYWVITDYKGEKNSDGFDTCFGGIRVDVYQNTDKTYEIRPLETMKETYRFANMYTSALPESYYGRNHDSFDDVFITKNPTTAGVLDVNVNYPMMMGHYYTFQIKLDGLGYYYPTEYAGKKLDILNLNGYGTKSPHNFYPSYMPPLMASSAFYTFNNELYTGVVYDKNGMKAFSDYFMGWKNELPLYVVGSNLTVNGKSILVDKTVKLPNMTAHSGAVFVTYEDDAPVVFSGGNNPGGHTTEPSIANLFAGFWSKVGEYYSFSYHPIRGVSDVQDADFLNALLPVINNAQMATYAMGSTFPLYLGKVRTKPRQYYFKS